MRVSSHGFPFCLVSLFIGTLSKNIETEKYQPLSTYLEKPDLI